MVVFSKCAMTGEQIEAELQWEPIERYDFAKSPVVVLRNGRHRMIGTWGRRMFDYVGGELVMLPAGLMQWGEMVDGEFQPTSSFVPSEFATIPASMFLALVH